MITHRKRERNKREKEIKKREKEIKLTTVLTVITGLELWDPINIRQLNKKRVIKM